MKDCNGSFATCHEGLLSGNEFVQRYDRSGHEVLTRKIEKLTFDTIFR
jgi:hypothetical protein